MKNFSFYLNHTLLANSIFISSTILSGTCFASGFALIDNSASGSGQAFAGAAAVAEDPSTIYFNPAGMMYIEGTQVTAGMNFIKSDAEFNNKGSTDLTALGPLSTSQGGDGGNAGDTFFVPNFYYVSDFGGKYKIGLGVNAPFGLGTEYKSDWMGRYASTSSEVKSLNINPSIAFRANDKLSIGLGMNIQYMEAILESRIYQVAVGFSDGKAKITGDSWAFGFNGGLIYEITPATRLGVHYRSDISHTLDGEAKFKNLSPLIAQNPSLANQDATANIDTPSTFSISMTHQLNNQLTLLGDITHTKWSNFEELRVVGDNDSVVSLVEQNWSDSYRIALGMKYQYNDQWIFRTGVAHDETPIDDDYRTSRIPGDDRTWLSFGTGYSPSKQLTIDVAYSHLWVDNAKIDEDYSLLTPATGMTGQLKGKYEADVDILSVQATWKY
ncbi:MAG: outer membrane protein transport protein [gamma proteobacterium symbiont of Taylorina sp.]|nr:outer membrane protein transport protein [gamma proteobacterium symbiont of Taylorina sp.]